MPHLFKPFAALIQHRDHGAPFTSEYTHCKSSLLDAIRHRLKTIRNHADDIIRRQELTIRIMHVNPEMIEDVSGIIRISLEVCQRTGQEADIFREVSRTQADLTCCKRKF